MKDYFNKQERLILFCHTCSYFSRNNIFLLIFFFLNHPLTKTYVK